MHPKNKPLNFLHHLNDVNISNSLKNNSTLQAIHCQKYILCNKTRYRAQTERFNFAQNHERIKKMHSKRSSSKENQTVERHSVH